MSLSRERRLLLVVLLVGAALRLSANDVRIFSRADETHYLLVAQRLAAHPIAGYAAAAQAFIDDPTMWVVPSLQRWGYFLTAGVTCRVFAPCSYHTLTWLSTLGGIAAMLLTWLFGRRLVGVAPALLGTALVAVSPLQLALGRRALTDEIVCATVLAALWAILRVLDAPRAQKAGRLVATAVALGALSLSFKETFGLYAPGLFALWLWRWKRRGGLVRTDLLLLLTPLPYYLGYCLLTRSLTQHFEMMRITYSALATDYNLQFQSGPLHRYLIDLVALSPLPMLLAIAGAAALPLLRGEDNDGPAQLAVLSGLSLLTFALVSMNLRFVPAIESMLCLLAAWYLLRVTRPLRSRNAVLAVALGAVVISDLWIFERVFIERGVYDPSASEILKALDCIPH